MQRTVALAGVLAALLRRLPAGRAAAGAVGSHARSRRVAGRVACRHRRRPSSCAGHRGAARRTTLPSLDFPPGPLYVCESASGKTSIDYEPRVEQLCRRHPEMGPCQYERNPCRAKGGRVYTAKGEEVTMAVEAEYDRVVRRVRFQADGGSPPPAKKK